MARTLYATLVGIDLYRPPISPLHGCVNDIEAIAALLQEFGRGGEFALNLRVLKNAEATKAALIEGFRGHLRRARSGDVALFYYSGHGSQEDAPPEFWHLEPDRLDETLVCYDSRDENGWDLADKELALLIAEVAAAGPHVLCVLDCCHSGGGTRAAAEDGIAVRRAPTDRRRRPIDTFLKGVLATNREGEASSASSWGVVPTGKHLLLAACRSSETAKEVREAGTAHGAFTTAMLAVLRQTRGSITYRDLLKRVEAQVRLRVALQVPQIEASDPADLRRPFLGGAVSKQRAHFTLRYDREFKWVIDGGAIHGIPKPKDGQSTTVAIFDLDAGPNEWRRMDAALATAEVREVRPELSQVDVHSAGCELKSQATYRAIVVAMPLPSLPVYLAGDRAALDFIRNAVASRDGSKSSLLVKETDAPDQAQLRVDAENGVYTISRALAERPLISEIGGVNEDTARLVVDRLEHVARWEAIANLNNDSSRLGNQPVEMLVLLPFKNEAGESWREADPRGGIRLDYRYNNGKWQRPPFRLQLINRGSEDVYCALLWLGEDYSISANLLPGGIVHIPAGGSVAAHSGKNIYGEIPQEQWRQGRTEITDLVKLIVSTEQFDPTLFEQERLDRYQTRSSVGLSRPRNVLERLARRVHSRALSTQPEDDEIVADWATSDLSLTTIRPLDATEVPQLGQQRELGAGVTLLGHQFLKAKVRLVSLAEAGRSLGHFGMPAIFRDDPDSSQPYFFETPRGSDSGLGALQLTDVDNLESVTSEAPLRFQTQAQLAPGERLIPFAWDGDFYLPLGTARSINGGVEIELRQLPSPSQTRDDVERGVVSSVRILFQKIVSPYIGAEFDYPRLAAVSFNLKGEPTYETAIDIARQRVAAASRILLYVHGILGDTFGMTTSSREEVALLNASPQRIFDRYDLLLTFDYENINTTIEASAQALKDRLKAIGLMQEHGKTLDIAAHSMGGLVTRWFIEREGGNQIVQHLVTLGTPHAGSPWSTIASWATASIAIAINGLSEVAWPVKLLGTLVGAIETVDVTLDQMAPNSPFLAELNASPDPNVRYTFLVGNTSIIPVAAANGTLESLLTRLSPQRALHAATAFAFFKAPNDIAVSVASAQALPSGRVPKPEVKQVACDHVTFFSSDAGRRALLEALQRT